MPLCRKSLVLVLITLGVLPGSIQRSRATTVSVIHERARVVIAADSKMRLSGPTVDQAAEDELVCKIVLLSNDYAFASAGVSGLTEVRASREGFDVHQFAKDSCATGMSVRECVSAFGIKLRDFASVLLDGAFQEWGAKERVIFETVFAGVEEGELSVWWLKVRASFPEETHATKKGHITVQAELVPIGAALVLGQSEEARSFLGDSTNLEAVRFAQRIVEIEAKANPELVGGPLDVLVLGKRGNSWFRQKSGCRE